MPSLDQFMETRHRDNAGGQVIASGPQVSHEMRVENRWSR
jgi:hypothetical protein